MPRPKKFLGSAVGVSGHFTVELVDAKTGLVKKHLQFKNVITDAGIDEILTVSTIALTTTYCGVGTGNTAPTVADTALASQLGARIARTGGDTSGGSSVLGYYYSRSQYTFTEAQANGTLAELGIFRSTSGGTMFSRQLFKDNLGNPTTITKTSSDQLRITYELRLIPPDPLTGSVTLDGVSYDWTLVPMRWGLSGALPFGSNSIGYSYAVTENSLPANAWASPTLATANGGNFTVTPYVAGSHELTWAVQWDPATGNLAGGIGGVQIRAGNSNAATWFVGFPVKIPKINTQRLILNFKLSMVRV